MRQCFSLDWQCRFYFAYCEAAFDAKYIHDFQMTWLKSAAEDHSPQMGSSSSPAVPRLQSKHKETGDILLRTNDPADPCTQVSNLSAEEPFKT